MNFDNKKLWWQFAKYYCYIQLVLLGMFVTADYFGSPFDVLYFPGAFLGAILAMWLAGRKKY